MFDTIQVICFKYITCIYLYEIRPAEAYPFGFLPSAVAYSTRICIL